MGRDCAGACVPPASPATPYIGLQGRQERCERRALQGFFRSLPESLRVAYPAADCDENETPRLLPPVAAATPLLPNPSPEPGTADLSLQEVVAELPVTVSPVPFTLDSSMHEIGDGQHVEAESDQLSEVDELTELKQAVEDHYLDWPAQTLLDMEDHLSRSQDLSVFWFFEARDRANDAAGKLEVTELPSIPEYPTNWANWKIESCRSRSAIRERKRSTGQSQKWVH